jgi:cytochrome c oxidase subunit II
MQKITPPGGASSNLPLAIAVRTGLPAWLLLGLPGCTGAQSTLDPHGPVAEAIANAWWVLFWGGLVIFALVMGVVLYAMFRRPEARPALPHLPFLIGGGLVFPIVVLTALLIYGTDVGRRITQPAENPLVIEVTGHQWWWEVRYPATEDAPEVLTANELRLPVGMPVQLTIESADVVHSFWIPNLGHKVDMIPGRTNILRLSASEAGRFRAQCSEFCGAQHARMGFIAIAEPPAEFAAWRERRAAATAVRDGPGMDLFMERGCGNCHAIAGTAADGRAGPTLTHFADRPTLGAATAANTPGDLRAWLADHGATLKPGSLGPERRELEPDDIETIARLLEAR